MSLIGPSLVDIAFKNLFLREHQKLAGDQNTNQTRAQHMQVKRNANFKSVEKSTKEKRNADLNNLLLLHRMVSNVWRIFELKGNYGIIP